MRQLMRVKSLLKYVKADIVVKTIYSFGLFFGSFHFKQKQNDVLK